MSYSDLQIAEAQHANTPEGMRFSFLVPKDCEQIFRSLMDKVNERSLNEDLAEVFRHAYMHLEEVRPTQCLADRTYCLGPQSRDGACADCTL